MTEDATEIIKTRIEKLNKSFLTATDLEDYAQKYFPSYFLEKPFCKPGGPVDNVISILTKIEQETPSAEEMEIHVQSIKESVGDNLEGWLLRLAMIPTIGFVGEEPTIGEFCSDTFDTNRVKTNYILASYPLLKGDT